MNWQETSPLDRAFNRTMALLLVTVAVVIDISRPMGLRLRTQLNCILRLGGGRLLWLGLRYRAADCGTADEEDTGLIILLLAPTNLIGPFARKLELMYILSFSGFPGVILRGFKRSDSHKQGCREMFHEQIVMNESLASGVS